MKETRSPNKTDVMKLAKLNGQCLTIFVPVGAAGRERMETPIRLKNALDRAHELLEQSGMRSTLALDMLKPARDLDLAEHNWISEARGLGLFFTKDGMQAFQIPFEVPELTVLGERMHIRPLLPLLHQEGCFVLTIHEKEARLLHVKGNQATEYKVPEMPANLEEALGPEHYIKERQLHSVGPAGRFGAVSHGSGDRAADQKDRDLRYCQAVDRAILNHFHSMDTPIILAASEPIKSIYRNASHYQHLTEETIDGCHARTSDADIAAAATQILEKHESDWLAKSLDAFGDAEANGKGMRRIEEILRAAGEGRVGELYLDREAFLWGAVADDMSVKPVPEQEFGTEDLFNRAAIETLATGGLVYELQGEPRLHTGAVATLRF